VTQLDAMMMKSAKVMSVMTDTAGAGMDVRVNVIMIQDHLFTNAMDCAAHVITNAILMTAITTIAFQMIKILNGGQFY
jgi:hypothetical protein